MIDLYLLNKGDGMRTKLTEEEKALKLQQKEQDKINKDIARRQNKVVRLKEKLEPKYDETIVDRLATHLSGELGLTDKNNYLYGNGKPNGIMVIIDYPTTREDRINQICYGTPRRFIDDTIKMFLKTYKLESNIYWTNAVPVGIRIDNTKIPEQIVWKQYIDDMVAHIEYVQPKKILCLGGTALSIVLRSSKGLSITSHHGRGYNLKYSFGDVYMLATYNPYSVVKDENYGRDVIRDIEKLLNPKTTVLPEPAKTYTSPENEVQLVKVLNFLNTKQEISCDIETTGKNFFSGEIESIGFGTIEGYNLIVNHVILKTEWCRNIMKKFLTNCKPLLVFHNSKFDVKWLEKYIGCKMTKNIADTLLMNYCLDERPISSRYATQGLKDLSRMYFDAEDYHFEFTKWNKIPEADRWIKTNPFNYYMFWEYQCLDLQYTIRLYHLLMAIFEQKEPRIFRTYKGLICSANQLFIDAEEYGVLVDKPYLEKLHEEYSEKEQVIRSLIKAKLPEQYKEMNVLSTEQFHKFLEDIGIKAGARRVKNKGVKDKGTGKDEIKQYIIKLQREIDIEGEKRLPDTCLIEQKNDYIFILQKLLDLRQVAKLNSTYFKGLLEKIDADGKVRSDIRIAGTTTGRLSSGEPNLQNIPSRLTIDGKDFSYLVKSAFIVPEGYKLLEIDYAQLELRMAAYLSKDEVMAELFRKGTDMHKVVAGRMFHKEPNEVTKFQRYLAKAVGFGILYGRGAAALVDGVEMDEYVSMGGTRATVQEMQQFIDDFLNQFPTLKVWIGEIQDFVMHNYYVQTIFGRKRRFPVILQDVGQINEIKRQAVNTLIQSAASDLCLSAAIKIDKELKSRYPDKAHFLLSVHDSIMVEAKDEIVDEVRELMEWCMSKGVINTPFVPFDTESKKGYTWGSTEVVK